MTPGWVYVLTNPAMPGLVKIGLTSRNPQARAAELTRATGVPAPFVIAWCRAVSDCAYVEAAVHRMLSGKRVSGRREFFRCEAKTARQAIEAAAGSKLGRRFRSQPRRRRPPAKRRHRGRTEPTLLFLISAGLLAVLAISKPPIPTWLPAPLAHVTAAVKGLIPAPLLQ